MYCPTCGGSNPASEALCSRCGNYLQPGQPTTDKKQGTATASLARIIASFKYRLALICFVIIYFPVAFFFPGKYTNEGTAIDTLYEIAEAEERYFLMKNRYGSLRELVRANLLPGFTRKKDNYKFRVTATMSSFEAFAVPVRYRPLLFGYPKSFYLSSSSENKGQRMVHWATGKRRNPNASDPIVYR
jgi:hypothetical protein